MQITIQSGESEVTVDLSRVAFAVAFTKDENSSRVRFFLDEGSVIVVDGRGAAEAYFAYASGAKTIESDRVLVNAEE